MKGAHELHEPVRWSTTKSSSDDIEVLSGYHESWEKARNFPIKHLPNPTCTATSVSELLLRMLLDDHELTVSMPRTILVITSIPDFRSPSFLSPVIVKAATEAQTRLIILLISAAFEDYDAGWEDVQALLTFVYLQATEAAHNMDNILLDVNVLLRGSVGALNWDEKIDVIFLLEKGMYAGRENVFSTDPV